MTNERSSLITIGGEKYEMILTTRATKAISNRYGGLDNLGDKLMKSENMEMALDEIIWLITLLCNQSIEIYNLRNSDKKPLLTEETVELLTSPGELAEYKDAITEAMLKGTKRNVESEHRAGVADTSKKRSNSRVNDAELFTRLFYYGTAQLHLSSEEVWLMPFGFLLDLWECHKQFMGITKPKREADIDEVVPMGI